jgi:hypothetical protein
MGGPVMPLGIFSCERCRHLGYFKLNSRHRAERLGMSCEGPLPATAVNLPAWLVRFVQTGDMTIASISEEAAN